MKLSLQPLVENALYHGIKNKRGKGKISISGWMDGLDLLLFVRDNGIGIPKSEQSLIWDRFYKTDLSRGKDKKGTVVMASALEMFSSA